MLNGNPVDNSAKVTHVWLAQVGYDMFTQPRFLTRSSKLRCTHLGEYNYMCD